MSPPPDFTVLTLNLRFAEGPIPAPDGYVILVENAGRALTRGGQPLNVLDALATRGRDPTSRPQLTP